MLKVSRQIVKADLRIVAVKLSLILLLFSCGGQKCCEPTVGDTGITILVKDHSGNNLLSASTPGYYNPDEIKIFYLKNGVKTLTINASSSQAFEILKGNNNEPTMRLFPFSGTSSGDEITTTYIQWRTNDEDVIESSLTKSGGPGYCSKVKCNGILKYNGVDSTNNYHRLIKITK